MLGRSALLAATNSVDYGNWLGNYSAVSLLLRGATTTIPGNPPIDESPIATRKTITVVGNALVSTAVARWNQGSGGSSLAFDGSGDSLTAPSGADFNFGTSPFTVECWVYFNQVNLQYQTIFSLISGSFTAFGFSLNTWTSNQLAFSFYNASSNPTFVITGASNTLTINTWYHVAVTRDSSNVFRLFLNGVKQGTDVTSTLSMIADRTPRVGEWTDSGYAGLNGYIDDLRITKGIARYVEGTGANAGQMVFSGTNTLALPTAQLPANINDDPSYNSVSLLLRGTGTPVLVPLDESPTPKGITTSGAAAIITTAGDWKYTGSAISLAKGTNSFIQAGILNDPAFDFGFGDFTIEAWIKPSTVSGTNPVVSNMTGPFEAEGWMLFIGSGALRLSTYNNSGNATVAMTGGSVSLNVYQHIAVTRSSTTLRLFLGGNQVATTTISGNLITTNAFSKPLRVGRSAYTGSTDDYGGFIDDLRITKGIARYTSNFTTPPAELPNL